MHTGMGRRRRRGRNKKKKKKKKKTSRKEGLRVGPRRAVMTITVRLIAGIHEETIILRAIIFFFIDEVDGRHRDQFWLPAP